MKVFSMMKKLVLSACIATLGVCCFGMFAEQTDYAQNTSVEASAETSASVTNIKLVSSSSTTVDYVYVYFEGFNTKVNYDYNSLGGIYDS